MFCLISAALLRQRKPRKVIFFLLGFTIVLLSFSGCAPNDYSELRKKIVCKFSNKAASEWGEAMKGVKTRIDTKKKILALTFDACGSRGDSCDWQLIDFLAGKQIPATLFISGRWIDSHPKDFQKLCKYANFEIENHGLNHKPCSIDGKSAYGIKGTKNIGEIIDEIEKNALKIKSLTGTKPRFYRSGTAYYDEVGVEIAGELGYEIAGFGVLGDAGATYTKGQVKNALLGAPASSIVIFHMNHPESWIAEGVIEAIPELKKKGFKFTKLSQYGLLE